MRLLRGQASRSEANRRPPRNEGGNFVLVVACSYSVVMGHNTPGSVTPSRRKCGVLLAAEPGFQNLVG